MTHSGPQADAAAALSELSSNLRWAWDHETRALFSDIDAERFAALSRNPVALLAEEPVVAPGVQERALALRDGLRRYLQDEHTWADTEAHALGPQPVAYFSMEFGLHESLRIYSGGLGVLAGDHLKSASDLGVPLVGIGLMYREGYFQQHVDSGGWQTESYPELQTARLPIRLVRAPGDGSDVTVRVDTRDGSIDARVWELQVGRARLLLLDSNVASNSEEDRLLTARLYGGDRRTRIRQELLLGVGGVQALTALGIQPSVLHLNEGHCAFAILELIRRRMEVEGLGFALAAERVAQQTVFTTHTPVPAGHDRFGPEVMEEHLGVLRGRLGIDEDTLLGLGRVVPDDEQERFCMTVLALRLSRRANGVSAIHGRVSRRMWHKLWPGRAHHEVPIGHITNGVHVPTWMAPSMQELMGRAAGEGWRERLADPATWATVDAMDDRELWETHRQAKRALIEFARARVVASAQQRGEGGAVVEALGRALSQDRLLVGFARRFATYKRATLVLCDRDALDRMVNHPERPITLVFAGQAHPRDEGGKRLLAEVFGVTRDPRFLGKILFVEGYDMEVGRRLTQGVDVWLNNPRRPQEACGTSGEKAVLNGGLNCSVLDGWWAEAWDGKNGFAIGRGTAHKVLETQDRRDAEDLIRVLEQEVAPLYYRRVDRGEGPLPHDWVRHMKRSMRTLGWRFNSDRMVADYVRHSYLPAAGLAACGMVPGFG